MEVRRVVLPRRRRTPDGFKLVIVNVILEGIPLRASVATNGLVHWWFLRENSVDTPYPPPYRKQSLNLVQTYLKASANDTL